MIVLLKFLIHLCEFVLFLVLMRIRILKTQSFLSWQPSVVLILKHTTHIGLNTSVFRVILALEVDNVLHVLPQVVIASDMSHEASLCLLVKGQTLMVTNVASVFLVFVHVVPLLAQLSEGVDNNTEKNVVKDNLDQQEEGDINKELDYESLHVSVVDLFSVVTDTSTSDQANIKHCHVALDQGCAAVLTNLVRVVPIDVVVVDGLHQVKELNCGVNVHDHHHQYESHK